MLDAGILDFPLDSLSDVGMTIHFNICTQLDSKTEGPSKSPKNLDTVQRLLIIAALSKALSFEVIISDVL